MPSKLRFAWLRGANEWRVSDEHGRFLGTITETSHGYEAKRAMGNPNEAVRQQESRGAMAGRSGGRLAASAPASQHGATPTWSMPPRLSEMAPERARAA